MISRAYQVKLLDEIISRETDYSVRHYAITLRERMLYLMQCKCGPYGRVAVPNGEHKDECVASLRREGVDDARPTRSGI